MSATLSQYLPPVAVTVLLMLAALLLAWWLSRRGVATRIWAVIVSQRPAFGFLAAVLLFVVTFLTFLSGKAQLDRLRAREEQDLTSRGNLLVTYPMGNLTGTGNLAASWTFTGAVQFDAPYAASMPPQSSMTSHVIAVWPGNAYTYSLYTISGEDGGAAGARVRLTWLGPDLKVLNWNDSPVWSATERQSAAGSSMPASAFHSGRYVAPAGATRLTFDLASLGPGTLRSAGLKLSHEGVYIEQHPNGALGSIAFSFDWESAMGGAIHSQGMSQHDPAGAAQHGLQMRQGADWLSRLFATHGISATFYATGYNLLDGNTERRIFSGDPIYKWAAPKYRWSSDYWLTHKWFSDDPYGTYLTDPAWYFGDQTRALLAAGHEIAPHTFAHIYVRGSNPVELATDMDEWLGAAAKIGVPSPTTFAFPWRGSNSITDRAFFDVLYRRGIRAVTRVYAGDLKDQYILGEPSLGKTGSYAGMSVMPDFLLGAPSGNAGEEAGGGVINAQEGLRVLDSTLARRGTTSFWTHPEQLGEDPGLSGVRAAWNTVVSAAAERRDAGQLWIGTVANITAYQSAVMSVTATIDGDILRLRNESGGEISGLTLTLPGDVAAASSTNAQVVTLSHPDAMTTRVDAPDKPTFPARQLVIRALKPGDTTVDLRWMPGQEPPR